MTCSFMPFLHSLNKEHSLGTLECQANGMLVLPISFLYIKWPNRCDVITFHLNFSLCASGLLVTLNTSLPCSTLRFINSQAKFKVKCVSRGLCSGVADVRMMADSEGQLLPIHIIYISPLMKQKVPQLPSTHIVGCLECDHDSDAAAVLVPLAVRFCNG